MARAKEKKRWTVSVPAPMTADGKRKAAAADAYLREAFRVLLANNLVATQTVRGIFGGDVCATGSDSPVYRPVPCGDVDYDRLYEEVTRTYPKIIARLARQEGVSEVRKAHSDFLNGLLWRVFLPMEPATRNPWFFDSLSIIYAHAREPATRAEAHRLLSMFTKDYWAV